MLHVVIKQKRATLMRYTTVIVTCEKCGEVYVYNRRPGESLGSGLPGYCPDCKNDFPLLDYLIPEGLFTDMSIERVKFHQGNEI